MANPRQFKIPDWFLNRQKDIVDGKYSQVSLNLRITHKNTTSLQSCHINFIIEKL